MNDTTNELKHTTPETAEDSAGSLERVVRRPHPWANEAAMKLKAARAEHKRIYERTSPIRNDERFVVQNRERARKRLGLPIDGPKMKPGRPRKVV